MWAVWSKQQAHAAHAAVDINASCVAVTAVETVDSFHWCRQFFALVPSIHFIGAVSILFVGAVNSLHCCIPLFSLVLSIFFIAAVDFFHCCR
jgi:hypothetical protein